MLRIVFWGTVPFPVGKASTNRIITLAHSFSPQKHHIKVISYSHTKYGTSHTKKEFFKKGVFQDIHYEYTVPCIMRSDYKIIRGINLLIGFLFSILICIKDLNLNDKSLLITRHSSALTILIGWIICKLSQSKYIFYKDEYPKVHRRGGVLSTIQRIVFDTWIYRMYDGMIIITDNLIKYFQKYKRRNAVITKLPITVDMKRFSNYTINSNVKYVAYCGSLIFDKDGVDILIKAFSRLKTKYAELKLYIIGDTNDHSVILKLNDLIRKTNLENDVIFLGYQTGDNLVNLLCNSSVLALARPNSKQAEAGFPTKLGEYMATSKPVVVTETGEITHYLKDGENSFIAKPGSIEDFYEKLYEVFSDYERALKVGRNGREVAEKYFSYTSHMNKLNYFLDKIFQ